MNIKKKDKPFIDMTAEKKLFDEVKHTAEFKKGYQKELTRGNTAKAMVYKRAAEVSNNRRKKEKSK